MTESPLEAHWAAFAELSAPARLRRAAMQQFAEHGFDGASVRSIAKVAGVSAALVTHHFGSKEGLRASVDEHLLEAFGGELEDLAVAEDASSEAVLAAFGGLTARLFGLDPVTRGYLRRVLLDGGEAGEAMFDRLLDGARRQLHRLAEEGWLREDADAVWSPYQILFLLLGPLLLEPSLRHATEPDPFSAKLLDERSRANQRLLESGLFQERRP